MQWQKDRAWILTFAMVLAANGCGESKDKSQGHSGEDRASTVAGGDASPPSEYTPQPPRSDPLPVPTGDAGQPSNADPSQPPDKDTSGQQDGGTNQSAEGGERHQPEDDAGRSPDDAGRSPDDAGDAGLSPNDAGRSPDDTNQEPDGGTTQPADESGDPVFVGTTTRDLSLAPRTIMSNLTLDECLRACASEATFSCQSVDFDGASQTCELNDRVSAGPTDFTVRSTYDHFALTGSSAPSVPQECGPGTERDGLLCYPSCNAGFTGVGPVCWEDCPPDRMDDGATCRKDAVILGKEARGRGVGIPMICGANEEQDGALCYPPCSDGYDGVGPVCWQQCPVDFHDDGATCRKDVVIFGKESRGRGVGQPMICGANEEQNGALCYPGCAGDYTGVGPVCWENCPGGYHDDGATCRRDAHIFGKASYGRGAGYPIWECAGRQQQGLLCYDWCAEGYAGAGPVCWENCPEGYHDDGATCRRDAHIFGKGSYGRGVGVPLHACSNGQAPDAGLCYPSCPDGFYGVGPVCWAGCPAGFHDDGATCRKDAHIFGKGSYGRGVGAPLHACANGEAPDAGLCYQPCPSGFHGVGPVCWADCPEGFHDDGATCRKDVDIFGKDSYGRGAGYLRRDDYRGIFTRYIRDHHNMYMVSASPLTASERAYLYAWFPKRLVDGMKVLELTGMTGTFSHDAAATTYGRDLIVIRRGQRSNELLKHELVHACQYDRFGIDTFGQMYADQWVDGGYDYSKIEFERDAFNFGTLVPGPLVQNFAGASGTRADWYSGCK